MMKRLIWLPILFGLVAHPAVGEAPENAAAACLESAMPGNQIACLGEIAREAEDASLCLVSDQVAVRWHCVALYAEYAGDPASCQIIPEDEVAPASVGRDLCRVHLALSWREAAFCDGLTTPNLSDACYLQFVETGGDAALCDRIVNPVLKDVCG